MTQNHSLPIRNRASARPPPAAAMINCVRAKPHSRKLHPIVHNSPQDEAEEVTENSTP